ncbi:hypothetical protein GCM10025331_17420 [Actinoplanes utahensis]|nr:hypothetical protein Aut01nite_24620 [Actinoplanes utahensis]
MNNRTAIDVAERHSLSIGHLPTHLSPTSTPRPRTPPRHRTATGRAAPGKGCVENHGTDRTTGDHTNKRHSDRRAGRPSRLLRTAEAGCRGGSRRTRKGVGVA